MLTHHVPYTDLGGDYYTRQNPERAERRAVGVLEALGYTVTLDHPDLEPAA
jgi:transposase